jgi:hypothetical protein
MSIVNAIVSPITRTPVGAVDAWPQPNTGGALLGDISSAVYTSDSFSVSAVDINPIFVTMDPDGTRLYTNGSTNKKLAYWTLSTPFTLSTASANIWNQATGRLMQGGKWKADGTRLYHYSGVNGTLYGGLFSPAWTDSTIGTDANNFNVDAILGTGAGYADVSDDGTKCIGYNSTTGIIHSWTMPTPYTFAGLSKDAATVDFTTLHTKTGTYRQWFLARDDQSLYVVEDGATNWVHFFHMSTPRDITTLTYISSYQISEEAAPYSVYVDIDNRQMLILGKTSDRVYRYTF